MLKVVSCGVASAVGRTVDGAVERIVGATALCDGAGWDWKLPYGLSMGVALASYGCGLVD